MSDRLFHPQHRLVGPAAEILGYAVFDVRPRGEVDGFVAEEDEGVYGSWDPGEHFWGGGEDIMKGEARGYPEVLT
jgi:hypothetical protein